MAIQTRPNVQPGPQMPQKYPQVGNNYRKYGEVQGYIYYWPTDTYKPDPNAMKDLYQQEGLIEKDPTLTDQMKPIAAVAGTTALAMEGGKAIPGAIGEAFKGARGLLGAGQETPATAGVPGTSPGITPPPMGAPSPTAPPVASANGTTSAAEGGTGFFANLGGSGVASAAAANPIGMAGGALALGAYLSNMYEGGGKDIIKGKGKGSDYANLFMDINPVTAPINMALRAFGKPSVGRMVLGHESTKDTQKRRWGGLSEGAQGLFAANHPDDDTGKWTSGKYAGEEWSFDKAVDRAKDNPDEFRGVYGNMAALGDQYFGMTPDQQREFVRQNIAAGNYASEKGDVILKDQEKAKEIAKGLLGV